MSAATLLILYLSQSSTDARGLQSVSAPGIECAACTCPDMRSVWDIVWSCLVTIFACSWVSVHPDIPGPEEEWWRVVGRRLRYMAWAIMAPEIVLWWAARQWLGSRKISREQKEMGWTETHGHFLQMGGLMLYDGEESKGTLSYERFKSLLSKSRINFPKITQKEIEDRSKSDILSKLLVMGQTGWFILQCITRGVQKLPITELELSTLAIAALNGCMYFFWWNKPFGVQVPIPVQLLTDNGRRTSDPIALYDPGADNSIYATVGQSSPDEAPSPRLGKLARIMSWSPTTLRNIRKTALQMAGDKSAPTLEFDNPTRAEQNAGPMRVPNFYALATSEKENLALIRTLPALGSFFGAIHCVGWFFAFPTTIELLIWRSSSLYITGLPIVVQVCGVYFAAGLDEHETLVNLILLPMVQVTTGIFVGIFGLPLYVIARLLLLAESLVTLRDLSPTTYAVVTWTSFLPHV